jgi:mannose-6-phosphate isomerase-like protein (cupin superfamily)
VRYLLDRAAVAAEAVRGDMEDGSVHVRPLFDAGRGCELFAQRVLSFGPGRSRERVETEADETLYVLDGDGTLSVAGADHEIGAGTSVYVGRGTPWSVDAGDSLEVLSVLVFDPEPVPAGTHAVVDLAAEERRSATASRQFSIGLDPSVGCMSVTQFVGYVPPGRAPDHFHRYDEVLYVLEGEGRLHIDDQEDPLGPGSCVHLPARLVHCLENTGGDELRLCAVFRPAGSPAEAYYPDGTPATYGPED